MFQIQYARRADGAKTAYGTFGDGPALLIPPGQLSHIEWWSEAPGFAAALNALSKHRKVVIYDRHGCGLSDRDRTVFTAEDDMLDIEAVVGALDCKAIDLLGMSFGTGPAVRFAVEHPSMVRRLVLYGAGNAPTNIERWEAMAMLRRTDHDQFIRALAVIMFPLGTDELTFNIFVRVNRFAASRDVQEGYESFRFETATRSHLVRSPTLVLHRRDDQMVSFQSGRELAASIPGARFIPLEGSNHIPWTGDWQSVVEPIVDFLLDEPEFAVAQTIPNAAGLSARELEVLHHLVAGKSNQQIADELVLSPNTVIRHVSNIFDKMGATNRTEAAALARKAGLAD